MAIAYERYPDNIEADENSLDSEEESVSGNADSSRRRRQRIVFTERWPKKIGIVQIIVGFCTAFTAAVQVFVFGLLQDPTGTYTLLNRTNMYGIGLWSGLLLVLTGSIGLRAALDTKVSVVYAYFSLVLVDCMAFCTAVIICLNGYTQHWTTPEQYSDSGIQFGLQVAVTVFISMGFLLVMLAFTQYYEAVFCGDLQLCRRVVHCCVPCLCPRAISQQELLTADPHERPPNLPV